MRRSGTSQISATSTYRLSRYPSEPGTRLFQKLDFFFCRLPAQNTISMRIAAKPLYDLFVLDLKIKITLNPILLVQNHGDLMYF